MVCGSIAQPCAADHRCASAPPLPDGTDREWADMSFDALIPILAVVAIAVLMFLIVRNGGKGG